MRINRVSSTNNSMKKGYDDSLIDDNVSGATFRDVAWCDRLEKKTREWWARVSSQTPALL